MAARGQRGVSRVLEKLEASVNAGKYYEAHQMYRTLYFRYLGQNKFQELLDLLFNGSSLLLQHDQQGSGSDLGILLVDVLVKSETAISEQWIVKLAKLFELMNQNIPERDTFLASATKWTMDSNRRGHPLFHKHIAEVYWKEKNYVSAHQHFMHSSDGHAYAVMLIELHTSKGLKSEIDLFIAQAVLQFLCLRNIAMAIDTFKCYTGQHPSIKNDKGPPFLFPLLNFIWFLLRAVEEKQQAQFKVLRDRYAIIIRRDPNYTYYLDNIGRIWFGIELPHENNRPRVGLFGGLLKSIIGDADSSGDEGDRPGTSAGPELD